jgi:hypothetical protein
MFRRKRVLGLLDLSLLRHIEFACSKVALREVLWIEKKIKLGSWSAIGGAIAVAYIGFNVAGWYTGGAAAAMTKEAAADAVTARSQQSAWHNSIGIPTRRKSLKR